MTQLLGLIAAGLEPYECTLSSMNQWAILGFHVTSQYFPNLDVRHICAPRSAK